MKWNVEIMGKEILIWKIGWGWTRLYDWGGGRGGGVANLLAPLYSGIYTLSTLPLNRTVCIFILKYNYLILRIFYLYYYWKIIPFAVIVFAVWDRVPPAPYAETIPPL